ncbi:short-chain dehydrogenase reductase sdr [Lichtheimia corymbifera JMRC:FSU:9682]|uniref:Short-chain dehydrogenase reductase sdr n=1 Tax=Lichtheimia corymbifera JMRC:FSU:9682 TaxID=1263082 RepID=A0A068RPS7_9FUNG|nr:short-chain dehydrogenase reductase sdr [Lichtheimia corymbifera JMRC:FSU:9682]
MYNRASGLGKQVVESLIAQGAFVVIIDINAAGSEKVVAALGKDHVFFPGSVDVSSEEQFNEALHKGIAQFPQAILAGAIICSGVVWPPHHLEGYGPENALTSFGQFKHIVGVNLLGAYNVAQQVANLLIKNDPFDDDGQRGVIITTSSIMGLDGSLLAYGTSKAGVAGMTLPMARELANFGVRVMSIAPGPFETPLVHAVPNVQAPPCLFPKRYGRPSEFADLVLHIIDNPMLNGSVIRLDGAIRA